LGISGPCSWPAIVVAGLPKTRSGKIPRGTMRRIADGEDYPMPATIDDSAVFGLIEEALAGAGYGGPSGQ
jgi:propionyl-CoA synthetase